MRIPGEIVHNLGGRKTIKDNNRPLAKVFCGMVRGCVIFAKGDRYKQ